MRAPDDSPCWDGDWRAPEAMTAIWTQSAVARTVRALPELHPLRLGDNKGTSGRVLAWCAATGATPTELKSPHSVGVLTQLSQEPDLTDHFSVRRILSDQLQSERLPIDIVPGWPVSSALLSDLVTGLPRELADALADSVAPPAPVRREPAEYRKPAAGTRRWAGALAQIPSAWLPAVALLPREERDLDDPRTRWSTESVAFAERHAVHCDDVRLVSDLLAPHVMALVLDRVPSDAAVTIYGDALHIWWNYDRPSRNAPGLVASMAKTAADLVAALPSFVLTDYPDNSHQVQDRLAERAAEAAAYRAGREASYAARRLQHGL